MWNVNADILRQIRSGDDELGAGDIEAVDESVVLICQFWELLYVSIECLPRKLVLIMAATAPNLDSAYRTTTISGEFVV